MENLTVLPYLRIYFRVLNAIEKSCFSVPSEKEKKTERKKITVRFQLQEGRGRKFNHAPRAGKELTAGGSRTQTSIAGATGNVPSAKSKTSSEAITAPA